MELAPTDSEPARQPPPADPARIPVGFPGARRASSGGSTTRPTEGEMEREEEDNHAERKFHRQSWTSEVNRHLRSLWQETREGAAYDRSDDPLYESEIVDAALIDKASWATRLNARAQDVWLVAERERSFASEAEAAARGEPEASWASGLNRGAMQAWTSMTDLHRRPSTGCSVTCNTWLQAFGIGSCGPVPGAVAGAQRSREASADDNDASDSDSDDR